MNISSVKCSPEIEEFLKHSNYIEGEYGDQALMDAKLAWITAQSGCKQVNINYILSIHNSLLKNLKPKIAGKFRSCDVWIGGIRKLFINKRMIYGQLNGWLKFYKKLDRGDEKICKKAHIDFENIHPFEDGNGRVGRILYNIHRLNCELPIHIIHEGNEQQEYYKWFKK